MTIVNTNGNLFISVSSKTVRHIAVELYKQGILHKVDEDVEERILRVLEGYGLFEQVDEVSR